MTIPISPEESKRWTFTASQWLGLMAAGETAAAISLTANSCVFVLHIFMCWYRPVVVNRLSLRMIVVAITLNMIFCACQIAAGNIINRSKACRIIAFVLIATDTMACMCIAMVGLNLVMIFVLKVSKSIKLEIVYYFIVAVSGIAVCLVPLYLGTPKGPNTNQQDASCWFYYYFDGRFINTFNWMWYYGWLMFSSVFAALCAAISIRFVVKKQENFKGALDMFTRRSQKDMYTMAILKKYTTGNTDVFQKIARRCICYPLVPLISKSWGIAIEIAAAKSAPVPFAIYLIDRIFFCLLGFMISCIYFTDPAIIAVIKETADKIKQRYVHDYFSIQYQPAIDSTKDTKSQYPRLLKVVPVSDDKDSTPECIQKARSEYFSQDMESNEENGASHMKIGMLQSLDHNTMHPTQRHTKEPLNKPQVPTITIKTVHRKLEDTSLVTERSYSALNATSINGKTYVPNNVHQNITNDTKNSLACLKSMRPRTIPMRRIDNVVDDSTNMDKKNDYNHQHKYLNSTETIETLESYRYPRLAILIHWMLINIFRVKTACIDIKSEDTHSDDNNVYANFGPRQDGSSRVFQRRVDNAGTGPPKTPRQNDSVSFRPDVDNKSLRPLSNHPSLQIKRDVESEYSMDRALPESSGITRKKSQPEASSRESTLQDSKGNYQEKRPELTIRRASSINVASLQRSRENKKTVTTPSISTLASPLDKDLERVNFPSKLTSSLGLNKMLKRGRSMSLGWSRLTNTRGKYNTSESPLNLESLATKNTDGGSSTGIDSSSGTASFAQTRPEPMRGEHQQGQFFTAESDTDKDISLSESEAFPYPYELAPRPITQYKNAIAAKQALQERRELAQPPKASTDTVSKATTSQEEQQTRSDTSEGMQLRPLNDLLDNLTPLYQDTTDLDELNKHNSIQSEFSVIESDMNDADNDLLLHQQKGLSYCYTTIDFISNWTQDDGNDDADRITSISESWDLGQQLKVQFELADRIAHM